MPERRNDEFGWRRAAFDILTRADPAAKAAAARRAGDMALRPDDGADGLLAPPPRPARPDRPLLMSPQKVPKRSLGSPDGRIALLHALTHIELNAIDLAFDMALRFEAEIAAEDLDSLEFVQDWFAVGAEEGLHFELLTARLAALGGAYGDLPAHGALWDAAERTADSAIARLAIAPLVLEARGLDVTPDMAGRLRAAGDEPSALILDRIFADEVGHVGCGAKWFARLCARRGQAPAETFEKLVTARFRGGLKRPFNTAARAAAGLPAAYYAKWNEDCGAEAAER